MALAGTLARLRVAIWGTALGISTLGGGVAHADVSATVFDAPRPRQQWGYAPKAIRVQPDNWVVWSNNGSDEHTITASDGSFDSGSLFPSEGFSWYFDQPGTFAYYCTLHPWMKGTVVVGNGVAPPAASTSDASTDADAGA